MGVSSRELRRESFATIGETCPSVDRAFSDCIDAIKDQTIALREAMDSWIERALEAEDEVRRLTVKVAELELEMSREQG